MSFFALVRSVLFGQPVLGFSVASGFWSGTTQKAVAIGRRLDLEFAKFVRRVATGGPASQNCDNASHVGRDASFLRAKRPQQQRMAQSGRYFSWKIVFADEFSKSPQRSVYKAIVDAVELGVKRNVTV